jgi:subtilisin family serine protease
MTGGLISPVGATTVAAQPSSATAPAPTAQPPGRIALTGLGGGSHTITLITGDTVRLSEVGGKYAVEPEPSVRPDGTQAQLLTTASPAGVYVTPSDALPAIESGHLDRELFNVSYLAENGYTDDQAKQLPVIVQYSQQRTDGAVAAAADGLPASKPTTTLESINAAAVQVTKADAEGFWTAVRAVPNKSVAGQTLGLAEVPGTLRAGITKIWLDGKVHADLDVSVPLIGAPEAWSSGYDGTGTKVAVLDTGIDAKHPDLAGKVIASRSFIPGEDVQDGHGHGTHVTSTIVGSGAASDGRLKGVAPGAQLIVGKVLDKSGSGSDSGVIEGMEWAANSGASVVSMSLGSDPTDGTDPLSQAVNELTASTGALFVIAAGNSGSGAETVSAPGTADAALTVAATDKSDQLADFSSRGPRFGDGALKPDIAAPGVNIVAARAAGTSMGRPQNDFYTAADGTSMATPHVAGAAAILAQQHPDWAAAQLKAALMSTSRDDQISVYEQGAGRVDVGRAFRQHVFASTPNLDYGTVTKPDQTLTRDLTYTNLSGQPVTLALRPTLRTSGGSTVEGALSLRDTTLTVPAGGNATTTATLEPSQLPDLDNYTGAVTATADGIQLRSPVGVVRDVPKATLTIHTVGRDGQPANPWAQDTIDVSGDKGVIGGTQLTDVGTTVTRVPLGGTISVAQAISWIGDDDRNNTAVLLRPELHITADTEITLDARDTSEIRFSTPKPAEPLNNWSTVAWQRTVANGTPYMSWLWLGAYARIWASPTEHVTTGAFRFHSRFTLGQPQVTMSIGNARKLVLHPTVPEYLNNDEALKEEWYQPFTGTQTLDVVDVGQGRPDELAGLDLQGKLALLEAPKAEGLLGPVCGVDAKKLAAIYDAGAAGVADYPLAGTQCPIPLQHVQPQWEDPVPVHIAHVTLPTREGLELREQLQRGPVEVQVVGTPETPYTYTVAPYEEGRVPPSLHYTFKNRDLAQIDMDIHATDPERRFHDWRYLFKGDDVGLFATFPTEGWFQAQRSRRDWVGPLDRDVLSSHGMTERSTQMSQWLLEVYDTPMQTRQTWLTAPFTPGAITGSDKVYELAKPGADLSGVLDCTICVQGDKLWASFILSYGMPGSRQTKEGFWKPGTAYEQNFDIRLYHNGRELPRTPVSEVDWLPLFSLPDTAGEYRLTAENAQHHVEWTFTTPVHTERLDGSFCSLEFLYGTSERCKPVPVVFVSYDLGASLGSDNTVPAGRTHTFTVSPYHSPSPTKMPPIAGLKLWASTDDGATYTPVPVRRNSDGTYTATTRYPALNATTGAVTLKVEAWDTAGNTIKQITKRGFGLRAATG